MPVSHFCLISSLQYAGFDMCKHFLSSSTALPERTVVALAGTSNQKEADDTTCDHLAHAVFST